MRGPFNEKGWGGILEDGYMILVYSHGSALDFFLDIDVQL